ncbi:hypothetical protein ACWGDX_13470 [Streptomyces sp. NPDC055025]
MNLAWIWPALIAVGPILHALHLHNRRRAARNAAQTVTADTRPGTDTKTLATCHAIWNTSRKETP